VTLKERRGLFFGADVVCNYGQWLLRKPKATTFVGGIGKDGFGDKMKKLAALEGVNVSAIR
jgi:sugar/nucleoside kinase (ribokinase family)